MGKKVIIVGAVALGPKVACRLRRLDPDADILMIDKDTRISYGGCGIPYYVGGDVQDIDQLVSTVFHVRRDEKFFDVYKRVRVRCCTEAVAIDRKAKKLTVRDVHSGEEEQLDYDDLVLATGSQPFVPPVEGVKLPGVHVVANLHHAEKIKSEVARAESAVIVGGGAIGLEMAEAMTDLWGVESTVVEMMDQVLPMSLGPDTARLVENEFERNDVKILTGERVVRIVGDAESGVQAVETASGKRLECQIVIFSVGARPNTWLAANAGLSIGRFGGIMVDARMRTSDPNIYAGGDCSEVRHLISGEYTFLPLGSLANRQGRVIGSNIAGRAERFEGVVGTFCIKCFGLGVARAGLTSAQAARLGYDPVHSMVVMADRAHFYPSHKLMFMKLIADRRTRRVLGVEALGENGDAVKARVDAVAALLPQRPDVDDISNLEVGYAPPFASAMDIVNAAANALDNILDGLCDPMDASVFVDAFGKGEMAVLDVRSPENAAPYKEKWGDKWLNIPQDELGERLDEVPTDKPLAVFCNTGLRSYECQVLLRDKGFENLRNIMGGHGLLREVAPAFSGDSQES